MDPFEVIQEAIGDGPEWMRIVDYVQDKKGHKAELILELGESKRQYWFPLTPQVYRRFTYKISESRLKGLKYLQSYIRRYRDYSGWPSRSYVAENRIKESKSLTVQALRLFSENKSVDEVAKATNLSSSLVEQLCCTYGIFCV